MRFWRPASAACGELRVKKRTFVGCAVGLLLAGLTGSAWAQIYGGANGSGVVVLSNFSTDETPQLVVALPPVDAPAPAELVPAAPTTRKEPRDPVSVYGPMIDRIAREMDVSPRLLRAVIQVESGYQPRAVSAKGAQGLMQLMPATATRFGVRDAFDPQQNVRGGAQYLKWLLDFFRGDLRLALAAYNAGEKAVIKAGYRVPPIAETRDYVPKVLWQLSHPTANG